MTECQCDPPGSGEEFCTGHCVLRARIAELEAEQQGWEDLFRTNMVGLHRALEANNMRIAHLEQRLGDALALLAAEADDRASL